MKTASFVGVNLPQTPVHLVQILNSIFQWGDFNPGTLTFNPNSMKISNWTTNVANQMKNDLDWLGFTHFVAKIYQSQITRFWGKILNSNFCLCKKIDISQLCQLGQIWTEIRSLNTHVWCWFTSNVDNVWTLHQPDQWRWLRDTLLTILGWIGLIDVEGKALYEWFSNGWIKIMFDCKCCFNKWKCYYY